jgi:hypothetical protein
MERLRNVQRFGEEAQRKKTRHYTALHLHSLHNAFDLKILLSLLRRDHSLKAIRRREGLT